MNILNNKLVKKAASAKAVLLFKLKRKIKPCNTNGSNNSLGKLQKVFGVSILLGMLKASPVYAKDTAEIVKPLTNVNTLLGAMIAVVGGGVFFWGIVGMAGALMGSHDTSQIMNALWKIAAGALMISAATVYTFLMG